MPKGALVSAFSEVGNQWWQIQCPTGVVATACFARAKDDRGNILLSFARS